MADDGRDQMTRGIPPAEPHAMLELALRQLHDVVVSLDPGEMDVMTNCEPWTVRRLASHALNNQLLWGGLVAGQAIVSPEETMSAIPVDGDLAAFADDVVERAIALWSGAEVLASMHVTSMGELPGSVVILFPTVDALAHAWDLSVSVGRSIEVPSDAMGSIARVFAATCTDAARDHGLIQPVTDPGAEATETERLMAVAGRTVVH
jgi:uncharacterized protein (TIGR03086 family)